MRRVQVVADAKTLAFAAAGEFTRALTSTKGPFRAALSGGSTPRAFLALLADPAAPYRARVPWDRLHVYWGDERCVPPDHEGSNFKMCQDILLGKAPVPAEQVHRMPGELADGEEAARRYAETLKAGLGDNPRFDFIFLGLGPDGHTASLFPGTPAVGETSKTVTVSTAPVEPARRLTVTLPVLNAAARAVFVVSGAGKAEMVRRVLEEAPTPALPASLVAPTKGEVLWLLDKDAASLLKPSPKA